MFPRKTTKISTFSEIEAEKLKEKRRKRMELLKLPNNHDLYERHKAQARERTRRYREKMRQKKLVSETKKRAGFVHGNPQSPVVQAQNPSELSKSFENSIEAAKSFQFYQIK
jgi:hypothetical protein